MPSVQEMHEEISGRTDLAIYALNSGSDEKQVIQDYWTKSGFTFPSLFEEGDARGKSASALGVQAYPTNIVVGPDGKVKYASVGFNEAAIRAAMGL